MTKSIVLKALLSTLFVATTLATITKDRDLNHGHSHEYFNDLKRKQGKLGDDPIFVHLIPHTHDDVGWLKTVDEYYTGSNNDVQLAIVHLILSNTMTELAKDPKRKFTYVEMKFFSMWWETQTETTKTLVRTLVRDKRLEFVGGGWSMHDEACTHYEDMINNMMKGHDFLMKEFGIRPRIAW